MSGLLWGSLALVNGSLWVKDSHLFACLLKLTISGQLPTPREESLSSSLWRQLSTGGGPSCHDLPGGVAFIVSAKSPFGDIAWIGGREEDCGRGQRGAVCLGYGFLSWGWLSCKTSPSRQNIHVSTLPQSHWVFYRLSIFTGLINSKQFRGSVHLLLYLFIFVKQILKLLTLLFLVFEHAWVHWCELA